MKWRFRFLRGIRRVDIQIDEFAFFVYGDLSEFLVVLQTLSRVFSLVRGQMKMFLLLHPFEQCKLSLAAKRTCHNYLDACLYNDIVVLATFVAPLGLTIRFGMAGYCRLLCLPSSTHRFEKISLKTIGRYSAVDSRGCCTARLSFLQNSCRIYRCGHFSWNFFRQFGIVVDSLDEELFPDFVFGWGPKSVHRDKFQWSLRCKLLQENVMRWMFSMLSTGLTFLHVINDDIRPMRPVIKSSHCFAHAFFSRVAGYCQTVSMLEHFCSQWHRNSVLRCSTEASWSQNDAECFVNN